MSLVNTTVWATVSMSTIMSTPIWQQELKKYNQVIPKEHLNSVIKASLVMLGMSQDSHYSVERNVNIRSNTDKRIVLVNTTLYTFPVSDKCTFKGVYQNRDILHVGPEDFSGWGVSHIKMEDFGNDHDPSKDDNSDF